LWPRIISNSPKQSSRRIQDSIKPVEAAEEPDRKQD